MYKFIILIIVVAVVIVGFVLNGSNDSNTVQDNTRNRIENDEDEEIKEGTRVGNLAPDFTLNNYNGQEVSLSDFRDSRPVFINFWATWCPFCVDELPLMANVQQELGDSYVTLAVNRGEKIKEAQSYTDNLGVTNAFSYLMDFDDKLYGRYGGFAMPYSLFLDKDGVIRDVKLGPLDENELREKINKIIN